MRAADIVSMVTLVALIIISLGEIKILKMTSDHQDVSDKRFEVLAVTLKEGIVSQRLIACIMAIPQERREVEYREPKSFCRTMAALP